MLKNTIEELYKKVNRLIDVCEKLRQDNQRLQAREQEWLQERARLIEKNDIACTRVEAMIGHLERLQQGVD